MRTYPELQVKPVHETVPGELVVVDFSGRRVPAICAPFHQSRDGDLSFVLVYLANDIDGIPGPFFGFADERLLCLGTDYVVVVDPIARAIPSPYRGAPSLLINGGDRLLCVTDGNNRFSLALNLETGTTQNVPSTFRAFECSRWELRLNRNGVIDFDRPALFIWDTAAVAATQSQVSQR